MKRPKCKDSFNVLDAPRFITSNSLFGEGAMFGKIGCAGSAQRAGEETVSATDAESRKVPQTMPEQRNWLIQRAKAALAHAYAPYSKFKVGAAILTEAGAVFTGCNVENSSYGLTNCAERTAIFSAVAEEGPAMRLRAVAVWTEPEGPCSPCGACRQVIFEFGPQAIVWFQGLNGAVEARASELLPAGFLLELGNRA